MGRVIVIREAREEKIEKESVSGGMRCPDCNARYDSHTTYYTTFAGVSDPTIPILDFLVACLVRPYSEYASF